MNKRSIYFFIFIFNYCFFYSQIKEMFLNSSWQFKQKSSQTYFNAIVPGNVFNDLFSNKLIPDPFYSDNEKKVQWVENEDWEYKTYFTCDSSILKNKCIELVFDGLVECNPMHKRAINMYFTMLSLSLFNKLIVNTDLHLLRLRCFDPTSV
jgi:beta-mannosidase